MMGIKVRYNDKETWQERQPKKKKEAREEDVSYEGHLLIFPQFRPCQVEWGISLGLWQSTCEKGGGDGEQKAEVGLSMYHIP